MCQARIIRGAQHVGARRDDVRNFVKAHCGRSVGIFEREESSKSTALIEFGKSDQVNATHRAQQGQRPITNVDRSKRMARGVIGDTPFEGRSDVGDTEYVDEEFSEFKDFWCEFLARSHESIVEFVGGDVGPKVTHRARARTRWHDDDVGVLEGINDLSGQTESFWSVASVEMHLTAARLGFDEVDLVPKSFEDGDDRATGVGVEDIIHARHEERDAHVAPFWIAELQRVYGGQYSQREIEERSECYIVQHLLLFF